MSEVFRCEDKETLVAYLYGEVDADVRREVERHLRTCAACARETQELQGVRQDLQLWMPPEAELGFTIVQQAADTRRPAPLLTSSRWASLHGLPAWAQVAAAALFIAAGAAIANVQVRSTPDGFVVTTGWQQPVQPVAAITAPAPSNEEWRRELVALERNLRDEIAAQQAAIKNATVPAVASSADGAAVMRRVQAMIAESEERQLQEMALRFAQAERTWNVRWTSDRQTLNRQMGNLHGRTLAVQAGQQEIKQEILNQYRLQRVSVPQPNQ
jgi:anti-sigma factor RsiW